MAPPNWLGSQRLGSGFSAFAYLAKAPPSLISTLRAKALREAAAPRLADVVQWDDASALGDVEHSADASAPALRVTLPAAAES